MYKKIKTVICLCLLLVSVISINSYASDLCRNRNIGLNGGSYDERCDCERGALSYTQGILKSKNKATTKFYCPISNLQIYAYVEETNAAGKIKSNSYSGIQSAVSCTVNPAFYTPVKVFHRGTGVVSGVCPGEHTIIAT